MKLKLVEPRQGIVWVKNGLRVFFMRPMAFCLLFLIFMVVGPSLMLAVAPLATIGFMLATQLALQGRFPMPSVFIQPLRVNRQRLWAQVKLGLAYAACSLTVYLVAKAVSGDVLTELNTAMNAGKAPDEVAPLLSDPRLQAWWLILVGGMALLAVPFWFAPALIHWGGMGAGKAVFFSTMACWRNKGALLLYSLGWAAVMIVFALVSGTIFSLLGAQQYALAAVMPAALMLSAAFYASLYFTFADCFEPTDADSARVEPPVQETP
jgi:hypothetical protein